MSTAVTLCALAAGVTGSSCFFVLDDDDRIVQVGQERANLANPFVGQVIWDTLPGAEPLLRPHLHEARRSGQVTDFAVFYAGRALGIQATPAAGRLGVRVETLGELDVKTLASLAESLQRVEAELAARAPARHDQPAAASRPAPL